MTGACEGRLVGRGELLHWALRRWLRDVEAARAGAPQGPAVPRQCCLLPASRPNQERPRAEDRQHRRQRSDRSGNSGSRRATDRSHNLLKVHGRRAHGARLAALQPLVEAGQVEMVGAAGEHLWVVLCSAEGARGWETRGR